MRDAVEGKHSKNVNDLDRLLWIEEQRTGKRIYKRGSDLRHGLLNVQGICENILPPNNNSLTEKSQWKKALKAMQKEPQLMFQAMPSMWEPI